MAKYKAYPEYKDSGVEWLGMVPESWGVSRLKHVASIYGRIGFRGYTVDDIVGEGEGAIVLSPSNIVDEKFSLEKKNFLRWGKYFESPEIIVTENDILLVKTGSTYGKSTIIKILNEPMTINPQMALIKEVVVEPRFLAYWFNASLIKAKIEIANTGSGMPTMTQENINNFPVLIPHIKQDVLIADFLDHETAKIDNLIEKQKQLIELLKEKRQAVISHAVTKGLNPDVPMKDSGVEWLGEVPEHWAVIRLKYLINTFEQGWSPQCEARLAEGNEYGVLKVGCVNSGEFNPLEHKALPSDLKPQRQYLLKKNDLLISRANTKELVGSSAVVEKNYDRLILCDKLYRIKFRSSVNPYFISEYMRTPLVRKQIELSASGASNSMQNIGQDTIKELVVALPPEKESRLLVEFIQREINVFGTLTDLSYQQVALLQERRTALISAAVTGKIDVRNWVAPDALEVEAEVSQEVTA